MMHPVRIAGALCGLAAVFAAPAAQADLASVQRAYLEANPRWLCGNHAEDYAGKDSNTELTVKLVSPTVAEILEENIVYRHPREYRARVKYLADVREEGGRLVLDTTSATLEHADPLPAGGDWGDASAVHMVLTLEPAYLQPGVWEFTGYSETALGRIATSCNVPDVGRAPD